MVDKRPDFDQGEVAFKDGVTRLGQFSSATIPGQPLKITGVNTDGTPIYGAITAVGDQVRAMALRVHADGDLGQVLIKGTVKKTFGGNVGSGDNIEFLVNGQVIERAANAIKGYAIDSGEAADEGFIYFNGEVS